MKIIEPFDSKELYCSNGCDSLAIQLTVSMDKKWGIKLFGFDEHELKVKGETSLEINDVENIEMLEKIRDFLIYALPK